MSTINGEHLVKPSQSRRSCFTKRLRRGSIWNMPCWFWIKPGGQLTWGVKCNSICWGPLTLSKLKRAVAINIFLLWPYFPDLLCYGAPDIATVNTVNTVNSSMIRLKCVCPILFCAACKDNWSFLFNAVQNRALCIRMCFSKFQGMCCDGKPCGEYV